MYWTLRYLFIVTILSSLQLGENVAAQVGCTTAANMRAVTAETLTAQAISKTDPMIPPGFGRIDAKVSVTIEVDPQGKVICARASSRSQPILGKHCEDAARKWEFRPFVEEGTPVPVTGPIVFRINR